MASAGEAHFLRDLARRVRLGSPSGAVSISVGKMSESSTVRALAPTGIAAFSFDLAFKLSVSAGFQNTHDVVALGMRVGLKSAGLKSK